MKTNEAGMKLIKNFEGCRLKAYKCPAGKWTIGYGHTGALYNGKPLVMGLTITQEVADEQFLVDIRKFEKAVNDLKRDFNVNQFSALASFCFNLGSGNLKTLCKGRTNAQIADAILLYNKSGGKVLDGLVRRRKEERELFLTPIKQESELPYKVETLNNLRIRKGPGTNYDVVRVAKKGSVLTVWAITENKDGSKWAKSWDEYFCLDYCKRV